MTRRRLIRAGLLAPPVAVAVIAVLGTGSELLEWPPPALGEWAKASAYAAFFMFLYGTPMALATELVVGVPAYLLLRAVNRLNAVTTIAVAAVAGFVLFPVATTLYSDLGPYWRGAGPIGAAGGAAAGAVLWWFGLRRSAEGA